MSNWYRKHPCGMTEDAVETGEDIHIAPGPLRDIITVLVGLCPRCRECDAPLVQAEEKYGCRGLVCCPVSRCASNAEQGLRPTAMGAEMARAFARLLAVLDADPAESRAEPYLVSVETDYGDGGEIVEVTPVELKPMALGADGVLCPAESGREGQEKP